MKLRDWLIDSRPLESLSNEAAEMGDILRVRGHIRLLPKRSRLLEPLIRSVKF